MHVTGTFILAYSYQIIGSYNHHLKGRGCQRKNIYYLRCSSCDKIFSTSILIVILTSKSFCINKICASKAR